MRLADLQLIVFDFDGIFTDNKVYVDQFGRESVVCSRTDSLGVALLLVEISQNNYPTKVIVVSTETNDIVMVRCKKMGLKAFTGVRNKHEFVREFAAKNDINLKFSLYAGNDLNDFEAMKLFGVRFAPVNAHSKIKSIATNNLDSHGGDGFVRDLIEYIAPEVFDRPV